MTFSDKYLESYFIRLKPAQHARAQLAWLKGQGPRPKPEEYGLSYGEVQAVRIKLAGYK
jgi:hypothetical protein